MRDDSTIRGKEHEPVDFEHSERPDNHQELNQGIVHPVRSHNGDEHGRNGHDINDSVEGQRELEPST